TPPEADPSQATDLHFGEGMPRCGVFAHDPPDLAGPEKSRVGSNMMASLRKARIHAGGVAVLAGVALVVAGCGSSSSSSSAPAPAPPATNAAASSAAG